VDLPRRLAFMVEALGEFDFQLVPNSDGVKITLKVRRALVPGAESEWLESLQKYLVAFEGVMKVG
jgi:inactivated superfamily I helicase